MSVRTYTFCDICNVDGIVVNDRRESPRSGETGRRASDQCSWFEGLPEESVESGWIVTSKGKHICPKCFLHHKEAVFSL